MIIDAHAHSCGDFLKGKDIIRLLDDHRVDKVILVPGEIGSDKNYTLPDLASRFPNTDVVLFTNLLTKLVIGITGAARGIDEGNSYVHSLVNRYPERIIQFYWLRLSQPGVLKNLERDFAEYKFKGIKLHQCWERFKIRTDIFNKVAGWAAAKNLPVFVHLFSQKQASHLAEYIKDHPQTTFIIAHLFGLERYITAGITTKNVFFEISTPQLVSKTRLYKAIKYFGADRILLGSDIPYGKDNLAKNIARVKNLNIPEADKKLILGLNTKKLLKI